MFNNWNIFDRNPDWVMNDQVQEQLVTYYNFLVQENQKYNLTRITEINEVFEKHFLDSLLFTKEFPLQNQKLVDIGTGAGFPGIILKIFYPELKITLIESNTKKANFLKQAIALLKLKDIEVVNQRAEEFTSYHREEYDIVVSRAVAYLDILLELGSQLVKIGGVFVALKGPRADDEVKQLQNKDQKLGFQLLKKQIVTDQDFGQRINLFYQKIQPTPTKYPRKYAVIKKESNNGN